MTCRYCGGVGCLVCDLIPDQTIARDTAIAAVEDPPWQSFAMEAIEVVCALFASFTSDDVWRQLDRVAVPRPTEPRAMGAAMRKAINSGICEPTGFFRIAPDPASANHRRPQRVYRSAVYHEVPRDH